LYVFHNYRDLPGNVKGILSGPFHSHGAFANSQIRNAKISEFNSNYSKPPPNHNPQFIPKGRSSLSEIGIGSSRYLPFVPNDPLPPQPINKFILLFHFVILYL
jgi:hypothetical protein